MPMGRGRTRPVYCNGYVRPGDAQDSLPPWLDGYYRTGAAALMALHALARGACEALAGRDGRTGGLVPRAHP